MAIINQTIAKILANRIYRELVNIWNKTIEAKKTKISADPLFKKYLKISAELDDIMKELREKHNISSFSSYKGKFEGYTNHYMDIREDIIKNDILLESWSDSEDTDPEKIIAKLVKKYEKMIKK